MFTDLIPIIMPAISFKFQLKYGALPYVCNGYIPRDSYRYNENTVTHNHKCD